MIFLRSLIYNVAFYINLVVLLVIALPTFVMPRAGILFMAKTWGRSSTWLLRVICGTKVEWRGLEKLPKGGYLVAAKHQSIWEAFALVPLFPDPTFLIKRELEWIPIWGWLALKAQMIPVDRSAGGQTIPRIMEHARRALAEARQIVVFPEGTRRAPDAEPAYKIGVARIYLEADAPCVPIALNSGLFWPRRQFLRYPGTIIVEVLDPIPPGMGLRDFFERLQADLEAATARLVAEGRAQPEFRAAIGA